MFTSRKPFTFGMELEINRKVRRGTFKVMPWMNPSHAESNAIYEYQTLPCDGREFLRRSCILGHMLGFEHAPGSHDKRAESFHLHMGYRNPNGPHFHNRGRTQTICADGQMAVNPLLIAAHHLSRTGTRFRTRWESLDVGYHPRCSEGQYLTTSMMRNNSDHGTMELRLNDSPSPIVPTILFPTIVNPAFRLSGKELGVHRGEGSPMKMARSARKAMGEDMFNAIIKDAKKYWRFDLVDQVLDMFVEGATNKDVWAHADTYFRNIKNGAYSKMLREAGL